jgi:hypothetical protein
VKIAGKFVKTKGSLSLQASMSRFVNVHSIVYYVVSCSTPLLLAQSARKARCSGSMDQPRDRNKVVELPVCNICLARRSPGTQEMLQVREEFDTYTFNINIAKQLAAGKRNAAAIAGKSLVSLLALNDFDENHFGHVDPAVPGIFTRRFGGLVLLDGVHRAARCIIDERPFLAFELRYEESLQCLLTQQIHSRNAEDIVRRLRRSLERFPNNPAPGTAIECSPQVLERVIALLTSAENETLKPRAVPRSLAVQP